MPWPALSKAYCSYVNVATTINTSTSVTARNLWWMLKAALRDQLGPPTAGTRHVNSVWTCVGSSDGTTAALDGVDRWLSAYDPTKLVNASFSSAHSWIILQNATLGVQLLLDLNSTGGSGEGRMAMTTTAVPFTLGSPATVSPPITSASAQYLQTVDAVTNAGLIFDQCAATTHYASITFDNDGQFYFACHRPTIRYFTGGLSVLRPINGSPGGEATFMWGGSSGGLTYRSGWPNTYSFSTTGGAWARTILGAAPGPGSTLAQFGPTDNNQSGNTLIADALSNRSYYFPVTAWDATTLVYRGQFPDLYEIAGGGVGESYPSVSGQTHIHMNVYAIPMLGGVPLMG